MSIRNKLKIDYWDVSPRTLRVSRYAWGPPIQLAIHGDYAEEPEFESSDPDVVWVDSSGYIYPGDKIGCAVITVFDSWRRRSARFVQVEVVESWYWGE
ncbi:hypothetical protein [Desulfohalovibrio reitneri]|uniref:hypothetical protein n=1 Tax=Desulfohalovibrio reitneri TaxID=1307759 RepID=UPI0004A77719|nr:hypothetical protein [Desulfohalovibrio reitneri]